MSIPKSPLVSICIPTFNRSSYVVRAVQSALSQTFLDIEVIVSDNCSPDDTWERLQSFNDLRLRLIQQVENIGMIPNMNVCLNQARGDLFLLLSDDDALEPTAIEKLSDPFRRPVHGLDPKTVGMTWCPCTNVDAVGNPMWTVGGGPAVESPVDLLVGLFNGTRGPQFCSIMVRTADGRAAGGYDASRYGSACDAANWGKAALRYDNVVCINEPLIRYTVHTATVSAVQAGLCRDWQLWINHQVDDFSAAARERGDFEGEQRLLKCRKNVLANITVTVLMRSKGRPGWVGASVKEFWRSREFMLTPFVAKRILKDGWKLLRLK